MGLGDLIVRKFVDGEDLAGQISMSAVGRMIHPENVGRWVTYEDRIPYQDVANRFLGAVLFSPRRRHGHSTYVIKSLTGVTRELEGHGDERIRPTERRVQRRHICIGQWS